MARRGNNEENWIWFAVGLAVLIVVVFLLYRYFAGREEVVENAPVAGPERVEPAAPDEPGAPQHPVPEDGAPHAAEAPPLPALSQSDDELQSSAQALFGEQAVQAYLVPKDIARRFVVMVDTLPGDKATMRTRVVQRMEGRLQTEGEGETLTLSPRNFARYDDFVAALQRMDAAQAVDLYFRYYPLFQDAYQELGYTGRYFNDRLIEVIDHLLATPELPDEVQLTRPHVLYLYEDPALENLSAGQKTLLRIGPENAAVVKQKLRELRTELLARSQPSSAPGAAD